MSSDLSVDCEKGIDNSTISWRQSRWSCSWRNGGFGRNVHGDERDLPIPLTGGFHSYMSPESKVWEWACRRAESGGGRWSLRYYHMETGSPRRKRNGWAQSTVHLEPFQYIFTRTPALAILLSTLLHVRKVDGNPFSVPFSSIIISSTPHAVLNCK